MVSTIVDRVSAVVDGAAVELNGQGVIVLGNVAGTNTVTAEAPSPITAYAADRIYLIRFANANTSTMTINIDGVGAVAILNPAGAAMATGQVLTTRDYWMRYTGSAMRLLEF